MKARSIRVHTKAGHRAALPARGLLGPAVPAAFLALLLFSTPAVAKTWRVDPAGGGDFTAIQDALNAASAGDTILVAPGLYREHLTWTGKSLALRGAGPAATVVDGGRTGTCLTLAGVPATARVEGFTFTRGDVGICVDLGSRATIAGNVVSGNGDGIEVFARSWPTLANNVIAANGYGGVLVTQGCGAELASNTITRNAVTGVEVVFGPWAGGWTTVTNCILWGNGWDDLWAMSWEDGEPNGVAVSYSDVGLGYYPPLDHCFDADPLFANPAAGDFHLPKESPCVDAGTASSPYATDLDGSPRKSGKAVDVGAYEFSANKPPVAEAGPDLLIDQTRPDGAAVTLDGSASSDPDGDALSFTWSEGNQNLAGPTADAKSGVVLAPGTHRITLTVDDGKSGRSSDSLAVLVQDTTPPALSLPSSITVEATAPGGCPASEPAVADFLAGASATDLGAQTPSLANDAPAFFPLGVTLVRFTAKDAAGNQVSDLATVTVVDRRPPTLAVPADIEIELATAQGTAVAFRCSASDVCDPAPILTCDPPSGTVFPLGTTVVTCTARDASRNVATRQFRVTVVDTTAPVVDAGPDLVFVEGGPVVLPLPNVSDLGDPDPVVKNNAPAVFPVGTTVVTWQAIDASGNIGTDQVAVTVVGLATLVSGLGTMVDVLPQLTAKEKQPLRAKLDAAIAALGRGQKAAAAGSLNAFINQTQALVNSRRLDPVAAAGLIAQARRVLAAILAR